MSKGIMSKGIIVASLLFVVAGAPLLAQQPKVEVTGFGGWTLSDGVSGNAITAGDGNVYNRIDPKDSASFGFMVGFLAGPNTEVGFIFGRQPSKLIVGGTANRTLGDMPVTTNHVYFGYNFGESDAPARPYLFIGLGSTNFASVDAVVNGVPRNLGGETQFSTTWGAGVKMFPSPHVGFRAGLTWTPTYIKSDAAGWWCDPYWGCYMTGSAQYSNQLTFSGGVIGRF